MLHVTPGPRTREFARHSPGSKIPILVHQLSRSAGFTLQRHIAESETPAGFTPTDIGLAFIAAIAQQAVEDFDEPLARFEYTDDETAVRLMLQAVPHAPTFVAVRSNVLWALKQLPIDAFNSPSIWGGDFAVQLRGEDLYLGKLSNKNRPEGALRGGVGQGGNGSLGVSEQKRRRALLPTIRALNINTTTTTTTTAKLQDDTEYQIKFQAAANPLPDVGIFSMILEFILGLAALGPQQEVETAHLAPDTSDVWIYVIYNFELGPTKRLRVYQIVAMLQQVARYCVQLRIYQELVFNLLVDDLLVATGCVAKGMEGREWCRGLESGGHGVELGVVGLNVSRNTLFTT